MIIIANRSTTHSEKTHQAGALVILFSSIMAITLLTPPLSSDHQLGKNGAIVTLCKCAAYVRSLEVTLLSEIVFTCCHGYLSVSLQVQFAINLDSRDIHDIHFQVGKGNA